jgi:DNA-binding response OmpR family regulator
MNKKIFKILLVEDNKTTSNFIIDFFSGMKEISIVEAGCITDANIIFNKFYATINFYIVDLYHPDGNGLDFLRNVNKKLNSLDVSKHPQAIIISSYISENTKELGKQLGVIAFLEKPFELKKLFTIIRKNIQDSISPSENVFIKKNQNKEGREKCIMKEVHSS